MKVDMRERYTLGPPGALAALAMAIWIGVTVALMALTDLRGAAFYLGVVAGVFALVAMNTAFTLQLVVGSDGVTVRRRVGRSRFFPYSQLARAHTDYGAVVLTTRDGEEHAFSGMANPYSSVRAPQVHASLEGAIAASVMEGIQAAERASSESPDSARARRSLREEAAAAREGEGQLVDYRAAAPVEIGEIHRVLDDPTGDETERTAAAVLLRIRAPEIARVRVAEVREKSTSPRLRALLETVEAEELDVDALRRTLRRSEER